MTDKTFLTYADEPLHVSLDDCLFYTVQDLPGLKEPTSGEWDLRSNTPAYLGNVEFNGKSVLELGPASGYLTFYIERRGGDVTSIDLSIKNDKWDVVPNCRRNWREDVESHMHNNLQRVQNAYWFAHKAFNSQARVVYAHVYDIPLTFGQYDISVMGSVLLHLSNPFLALQNMLRLTKERAIITDLLPNGLVRRGIKDFAKIFIGRPLVPKMDYRLPFLEFLPSSSNNHNFAWWLISPEAIVRIAGLFGFEKTTVSYHRQYQNGELRNFYTVVCDRTVPITKCKYL